MNIHNSREMLKDASDYEDEPSKKKEEKTELKLPFDMKAFWRNVNEKYFKNLDDFTINDVNHLVHLYSKYGKLLINCLDINNDHIFTKIGFPRTLNCLLERTQEIVARKNNPLQISKFFGMYMYIDKYDYLTNNLNNEDIDEEIDHLQERLAETEENNHYFFKKLQKKIRNEEGAIKKINLQSETVYQNRYENLTNQIFTLQMKQLAECIWNIKKDVKKNKYILIFDQSENIDPLSLDEPEYKELLKYRDPMNSISVYDLFQEKIFSYYNTGSASKSLNSEEKVKKKRGRKPGVKLNKGKAKENLKNNTLNTRSKRINKRKGGNVVPKTRKYIKKEQKKKDNPNPQTGEKKRRGRKPKNPQILNDTNIANTTPTKKKKEEVEIAKVVSINYDFCHHCKQRKPAEVMVKCKSSTCHKVIEKPIKTVYVNNTTLVRKFKNFIITNYVGDPKDILDGYLNKKIQQHCQRSFCNFCIKGSYDQVIDQIKDKKDWICPWCQGTCFCSRCIRYDQILKLIALYISYNGDMNILYDSLIDKSPILDKLSVNLLISNVIIIKNDPVNKSNKLIKNYTGKNDYEALDNIIDQSYKYRDQVIEVKKYFDKLFNQARHQKVLLNSDKKMTDLCVKFYESNSHLLGKKKKREDKEELIEVVKRHFDDKLNEMSNNGRNGAKIEPAPKKKRGRKPKPKGDIEIKGGQLKTSSTNFKLKNRLGIRTRNKSLLL